MREQCFSRGTLQSPWTHTRTLTSAQPHAATRVLFIGRAFQAFPPQIRRPRGRHPRQQLHARTRLRTTAVISEPRLYSQPRAGKKRKLEKKKAKWMRRAQNTRQHLFGRLPTWPRQGGVEEGWESLRRGVIPLKTDRRTRGPKSKNSGARRGYSALEPFSEQPPTDEAIRTHSDDARGTFRHDTVVTALAA